MKILAMYLPQYHEIPENNLWWGQGYTEWTAVKKAKPCFKGHDEPRIPLQDRYYDLVTEGAETWKWQADLAKEYGVYGFCIYHYWFGEGKQLLEKPMEILRDHPEIEVNYCICWANESWSRNWYGQDREILMEQKYGGEKEWRQHFEYLLTFFRDNRYIKKNNKPILHIYRSAFVEEFDNMIAFWNKLAEESGYDGLYIVSADTYMGKDVNHKLIDSYYRFEPGYTLKKEWGGPAKLWYNLRVAAVRTFNRIFKTQVLEHKVPADKLYQLILKETLDPDVMPGTFPQWDNTPRTGSMGLCYVNTSPKLFQEHLKALYDKYRDTKDFIYINAWNEWGEGAYLEPDKTNGYGYLEAIKAAVK